MQQSMQARTGLFDMWMNPSHIERRCPRRIMCRVRRPDMTSHMLAHSATLLSHTSSRSKLFNAGLMHTLAIGDLVNLLRQVHLGGIDDHVAAANMNQRATCLLLATKLVMGTGPAWRALKTTLALQDTRWQDGSGTSQEFYWLFGRFAGVSAATTITLGQMKHTRWTSTRRCGSRGAPH